MPHSAPISRYVHQEVAAVNRTKEATVIRNSPRGRVLAFAFTFVLGALLAGAVVYVVTMPSSTDRMVEQIRAESALRDKAQIKTLTELARTTRDRLTPMLEGLSRVLPAEGAAGPAGPAAVTAADVESWQKAADAAEAGFADPPSGETATNLARSGLASAVRQLAVTVDSYAAAQELTGAARANALALVARQRADAVFTWSVGATALDSVNVDAGYGHQHVFLPMSPGEGALTPDDAPEGEGEERHPE
ncbi:hypothetical protein ACOZ38_39245 [Sphaerisporangium viridialbum]|uniref:hypothetical protein n=1 Tax=Sphaerisporangium viridialbum TaxID=46189 RepID=UPI003C766D9D